MIIQTIIPHFDDAIGKQSEQFVSMLFTTVRHIMCCYYEAANDLQKAESPPLTGSSHLDNGLNKAADGTVAHLLRALKEVVPMGYVSFSDLIQFTIMVAQLATLIILLKRK